jgi:hypothetical protein
MNKFDEKTIPDQDAKVIAESSPNLPCLENPPAKSNSSVVRMDMCGVRIEIVAGSSENQG